MLSASRSLALVLLPIVAAVPAITPSQVITSPTYLLLQVYHDTHSNTPCAGIGATLNWPVGNTSLNSTNCFHAKVHHVTCVRRLFQQFDDSRIDTSPRACSIEGFQQNDCRGPSLQASYNGAAEWTWDGIDMAVDVQSFKINCATSMASPGNVVNH